MKPILFIIPLVLATDFWTHAASPTLPQLRVEAEEEIYAFKPANNGAGPMWCHGSTCLARAGDQLFASGIETLPDAKPLNNCRWMLFQRRAGGWEKVAVDASGRTREPCPLAAFPDGRLFLSANSTLVQDPNTYSGPARPEILQFASTNVVQPPRTLLPLWDGVPKFTEHSYRSFAADGPSRELILFQNIGYTHAEWSFLEAGGQWSARGQIQWPWGKEYQEPEPIRVCYPNVVLKQRAVHFCGVSDIVEPNLTWRAFKRQLTGQQWDYDFRRLFYTWTPDVTKTKFQPWLEIASREATCGWITPGDLWVAPDGAAHILWTERALDERLREKFFPKEKQSHALQYAVVREGKIVLRRTLQLAEEGGSQEIPGRGRFHVTPEQRLFVCYFVQGRDAQGRGVSENRLLEVRSDGTVSEGLRIPLQKAFSEFYTATPRAGSPPSDILELMGQREGNAEGIAYARIRLH